MRCRIVFSFILTALFQVSAFAQNLNVKSDLLGDLDPNSKNSCFCEIGKQPENQQFFFTLGCEIWLARQYHCNYKAIVLEDTNYLTEAMPEDTNSFSIGYVGHWASSRQFIDYLNASILPLMHKRASSVFIDNTACDAMKDAESVSRFLICKSFHRAKA